MSLSSLNKILSLILISDFLLVIPRLVKNIDLIHVSVFLISDVKMICSLEINSSKFFSIL